MDYIGQKNIYSSLAFVLPASLSFTVALWLFVTVSLSSFLQHSQVVIFLGVIR